MPIHEFPQPDLHDQHPSEHDPASDAAEPANEEEVTAEGPSLHLDDEPGTVELTKSEDDEAEEESVESASHQSEEEEVTNAEPDAEPEVEHDGVDAEDQHAEAEHEDYVGGDVEEERDIYEEEDHSDATTAVPEADELAENDLVEASTLDQPSDDVDPNNDEVQDHSEESTEQEVGALHSTDIGLSIYISRFHGLTSV